MNKTAVLAWLELAGHGAATGFAAVCVDTLRHVLLATDLAKHILVPRDSRKWLQATGRIDK